MALWLEKMFCRLFNQSRKENKRKKRLEKSKKIKEILSIAKKNVCGHDIWAAVKLKVSPSCHNIVHSTCSKSGCKAKGYKPIMILPAADLVKAKRPVLKK